MAAYKRKRSRSVKRSLGKGSRKRMMLRGRRAASRTVVNRGISLIAPRYITKLKYSDEFSLSSSAGVPALYQFNLNSLFDPDRTGVGHQPYGFDQIAALYDKYRVFSVSWRIEAVGATSGDCMRLTVVPADGISFSSLTNRTYIMELPRAITKEQAFGQNKVQFRGRITLPRLSGQTSTEYKGDDTKWALTSASPVDALTLSIFGCSPGTGVSTTSNIRITLVYRCEFWDPNSVAQS